MRKISIAIPSYNRCQMTIDSFAQVINDDRVSEVVIVDDASTDNSYEVLANFFRSNDKVKLFRNEKNLDCYKNKHEAASKCSQEWIVIFDSDNILTPAYLDALYVIREWDKQILYQPQFSAPYFDFRKFAGVLLTKENVNDYLHTNLETAMNAFNCFINREQYLRVWDGTESPGSSDSIFFSFCWLRAGNGILITNGLEYSHYISPNNDGHYQTHSKNYAQFHRRLLERFKELRG